MRKVSLSLLFILCLGPSLWAQRSGMFQGYHDFGLDFRLDLIRQTTDGVEVVQEDQQIVQDTKQIIQETLQLDTSVKFQIAFARLNFRGQINDVTKYRIQLAFNQSNESGSNIDNTSDLVQYWYLDRKAWNFFLVRVGKIKVLAGAIEQQMYNDIDLYHASRTREKLDHYAVGGDMTFRLFQQTLKIQLVNTPLRQPNQAITSGNVGWFGSFGDGLVETVVTGGVFPSAQTLVETGGSGPVVQEESDAFNQYHSSAGVRLNFDAFEDHHLKIEAEQLQWLQEAYSVTSRNTVAGTTISQTNYEETSWSGLILGIRYELPKYHILLRYSSDQNLENKQELQKVVQYTAGLEYYPDAKKDTYRIHAIYTGEREDNQGGNRINTTLFNVGATARF
ncbi:MAG: hypothetical protein HQM12_01065 [SAR324 cluster bacterium]|nr:hypothetical protein [SAR324 cluster bacterium]